MSTTAAQLLTPGFLPQARPAPARLVLVTAPAELYAAADTAVQLALKLDSDADATYVALLLSAARRHVERVTGLCLLTQVWRAEFDRLPAGRELELPRAPLALDESDLVVSAVQYLDTAGAVQTWASTNYLQPRPGLSGAFATLVLSENGTWPDVGAFPGALRVTFSAGFGAVDDVPGELRLAVLWLAAWWYEQRIPVTTGGAVAEVPNHLNDILAAHRVAFLA